MGFYSNDCLHCTHPLICSRAAEDKNKWMTQGVVITENNSIIRGEYDGYGRLDEREAFCNDEVSVYHADCWDAAGRPFTYQGPSKGSADQGWFFDDGVHNWPTPSAARRHPNEGYHNILNPKGA